METLVGCGVVGLVFGIVLYAIGCGILDGWVLSLLWNWFVAEQFGIRTIGIPLAIGLMLIYNFTSAPNREIVIWNKAKEREEINLWSAFLVHPCGALIVLFIGWIIKHYFLAG